MWGATRYYQRKFNLIYDIRSTRITEIGRWRCHRDDAYVTARLEIES